MSEVPPAEPATVVALPRLRKDIYADSNNGQSTNPTGFRSLWILDLISLVREATWIFGFWILDRVQLDSNSGPVGLGEGITLLRI